MSRSSVNQYRGYPNLTRAITLTTNGDTETISVPSGMNYIVTITAYASSGSSSISDYNGDAFFILEPTGEATIEYQRITMSEGAVIYFQINGSDAMISIFIEEYEIV
jgi:hypothetical protein